MLTVAVDVVDGAVQAGRVAHDNLPAVVIVGQGLHLGVRQVVADGPSVGADAIVFVRIGGRNKYIRVGDRDVTVFVLYHYQIPGEAGGIS